MVVPYVSISPSFRHFKLGNITAHAESNVTFILDVISPEVSQMHIRKLETTQLSYMRMLMAIFVLQLMMQKHATESGCHSQGLVVSAPQPVVSASP